jgi:hypothetical protein
VAEDNLLTASRPEIMTQASLLSAPLLSERGFVAAAPPATCTLSPSPESVKLGRDFTRATLRDWGMGAVTDVAAVTRRSLGI